MLLLTSMGIAVVETGLSGTALRLLLEDLERPMRNNKESA